LVADTMQNSWLFVTYIIIGKTAQEGTEDCHLKARAAVSQSLERPVVIYIPVSRFFFLVK